MKTRNLLAGTLWAGVVPMGVHAQQAPAPAQAEPAPRTMEFRGADGKPLPPEIQRQLQEQFRNAPPPMRAAAAAGNASAGAQRDIVVTGQRPRGAVVGDIPPERTLSPLDIRAYGANSIEELLQTLGPQVASGRGRGDGAPVVLLNGKRVASFAEIAKIPTEAIERMEVFPEELALKYGYRADQKVVNVVAFERFSSRTGQLALAAPTDGGRDTTGVSANYLRIQGDTRFGLDLDYSRSSALLESERDLRQAGGAAELGRFRTLLPSSDRLVLNGTVSGTVLSEVSATLNGRFEANGSEALFGSGPAGALARDIDTRTAHLGAALGGRSGDWLWTFTSNYDRTGTDTDTDTLDALRPRDTARSVASVGNADLLVSGSIVNLPAGPVSISVRGGLDARDFRSSSRVAGVARATDLSRDRAAVQANIDVPITGRAAVGPGWLGSLSASANIDWERLSDLGTLRTVGYGLNWVPASAISVAASITHEQGAPSVEQLGAPLIVTPNVRTFDFTRGEVVDYTRLTGGNTALRPDDRRVFSLGVTARPFAPTDLTLTVDYLSTRITDPIAAFPVATPAIEAAFPERFTRDAGGRLLRIDGTPLNFARSHQEQLRWGLNFVRPLGPVPPGLRNANIRFGTSEADVRRRLPPGAQVLRVEQGSAAARRYENLTSRLFVNVQHIWRLEDTLLVRQGAPLLDLLNGAALDSRGGRARHEVEVQAGVFKHGLGARVTANWQSGTTVNGVAAGGGTTSDLAFASLATVNINLFANMTEALGRDRAPTWLKGTRVTLGIANLFGARPQVRDASGTTPLNYQSAYLNPMGRLASLSLRKVF